MPMLDYSITTGKAYLLWIRRLILFVGREQKDQQTLIEGRVRARFVELTELALEAFNKDEVENLLY
ncbi:MAG TPA: hypothetical protein EYG31_09915 [Porticoccaceae bacterium]|jgi:hypothetical protein|nr:hypothetical protein [Gammaproteobacteria bacterium]HIL60940.1 hypothetical protein [Porticoccaceae bacterium]